MKIVILGLSITSSWGNGHATTFRGLVRELTALGHEVLFLERDAPWYAENRDMPSPPWGRTALYASLPEMQEQFGTALMFPKALRPDSGCRTRREASGHSTTSTRR